MGRRRSALAALVMVALLVPSVALAESAAVKAVKATMTSGPKSGPFREAPLLGGTAVLVSDTGAYWVKGSTVQAANGVAKTWSPALSYTGPEIGFTEVEKAVKGMR